MSKSKGAMDSWNEKTIAEQLEVDASDMKKLSVLPLIFDVLKKMNDKLDECLNLKKANEKLASKVTLLERRINELEFEKCRYSVRINNLAVSAKRDRDNKEPSGESMKVMDSLLNDLGIADNCKVTDAYRIPSKNSKYYPTMIATFNGHKDHSSFFKGLKFARDAGYDIYVNQQYPSSFTEELKDLEKFAKEIRKDGKFNTTVRFFKGQLELLKRPKGSRDDWVKVENPKVETTTEAK